MPSPKTPAQLRRNRMHRRQLRRLPIAEPIQKGKCRCGADGYRRAVVRVETPNLKAFVYKGVTDFVLCRSCVKKIDEGSLLVTYYRKTLVPECESKGRAVPKLEWCRLVWELA